MRVVTLLDAIRLLFWAGVAIMALLLGTTVLALWAVILLLLQLA